VPLTNFAPRGFGRVHHSIAILCHQVPNLSITIRTFYIAVYRAGAAKLDLNTLQSFTNVFSFKILG